MMKHILITFFYLISFTCHSQNIVYADSVFNDFSKGLFKQFVIEESDVKIADFKTELKNWIGLYFRNSKAVIDSETDNMMILKIRLHDYAGAVLIFDFKDEKMRVSIYDRSIESLNAFGVIINSDIKSTFRDIRASTESFTYAQGIMNKGWRSVVVNDKHDNKIIKSNFDYNKVQLTVQRIDAMTESIKSIDFNKASSSNW